MRVEPSIAEHQDTAPMGKPVALAAGRALSLESVLWVVVLAAAAGWRLIALGDGLPDLPEGLQARAAWDFAHGSVPAGWTGDLTAALAALIFKLWGDHLGLARLGPALFGMGGVAALYLLRPYLGAGVTLLGALLLACSPLAVASSRTLAPDAAGLLCGLLILWLVLRISEEGEVRRLMVLGALAGVGLTTGAVAVALALAAALYVGVEIAWLDREDVAAHWRQALRDRALLGAAAALTMPGLLLAIVRFGAGPDRLTVAAFTDFSPPSPDAGPLLPWHAALTILLAYEPLALVLGVAGAALLATSWARTGPPGVTRGERLLLVWLAVGLVLALTLLHQRPGQLLVAGLPLMLLAAHATVRLGSTLAAFQPRWSGPPLGAAVVIFVYVTLTLLDWTRPDVQAGVPSAGEERGVILIAVAGVGLLAAGLYFSGRAAGGVLTVAMWLLGGWVVLHGAAALVSGDGSELVRPFRPEPERETLVRGIEQGLGSGQTVAVERPIAAALAWELRGRTVLLFTGEPPPVPFVVQRSNPNPPVNSTPRLARIPVGERWYPESWSADGALRWLFYREPWGPTDSLVGDLLQTENRGERPGDQ